MLVIPAIDLRDGRCVRLLRGDFSRETVYGDDPVGMARHWEAAGARLLHVVDLDGAREGRPVQLDLIAEVATIMPIQTGGGLRSAEAVEQALDAGAERAVLGTAALDLTLAGSLIAGHGDRLIVALDSREGKVTTAGWTENSEWDLLDLAARLAALGVRRFLHTDVERDGAMTSPNYASLETLVALGVPVQASGGVSSIGDIRTLRDIGAEGVIVGRALYEGAFDLGEAIEIAR